ncbi:MAG: hypothetical protein KGQ70_01275, partial [Alphaproteobacteria bacterium]|nr:hypothetical protein [Alphaproteobacteria bacterium]
MDKVSSKTRLENICAGRAAYALLCLSVIIAYSSVWPNSFVFDDRALIVGNQFLRRWGDLPKLLTSLNFSGFGTDRQGFYRPIPMLLHFFVYQAFGLSTQAFHAVNIALQALNACLLCRFGQRSGFKKGVAFSAALLWAVHPLFTEAVAYMSSTPELLGGTFCLLGLTALLPDFTPRRIWRAAAFYLLALGTIETSVVFPALAAATFFFMNETRIDIRAYRKMWPLWLMAALYIAAWLVYMHVSGYNMNGAMQGVTDPRFPAYATSILHRTLTALATLPVYLGLILWPHGLHMERLFPVFTSLLHPLPAAGALMVALAFLQIYTGRAKRGLALSFGLIWFGIAFSPMTGILFPVNALVSEHWMYLPLMGLALGVLETVAEFLEGKRAIALVTLAALAFGAVTFQQCKVWRDPETLYRNIVENGGNRYRISEDVAYYYMEHHDFNKAIPQFAWLTAHTF